MEKNSLVLRRNKYFIFGVLGVLLLILLTGCTSTKDTAASTTIKSIEDLQNKHIGMVQAAICEQIASEKFPNAEVTEFNEYTDMVSALKAGQIDAMMTSYPTAFLVKKSIPEFVVLDDPVSNNQAAVGVKKGNTELLDKINACLDELKSNGTLDDMLSRWYSMDNANYNMPDIPLPTEGEPLKVGINPYIEPSSFLDSNGKVIGLDGELIRRIAQYLNRPIVLDEMTMATYPLALASGRVDMVVSNFIINPALEDNVSFSQPYFDTPFMMIVRKGN